MMMIYKQLFLSLSVLLLQINACDSENSTTTISIKAIPGLQYDVVRFQVKPEETVKLTFTNTDEMGHNMLITQPGTRLDVVNAALALAEKGPEMDYIPESSKVLWAIPVIYPGEEKTITFTAPKTPGAYPYVCTFPGHGFIMYGVMYVTEDETLPPLEKDENIPPARRQDSLSANGENMHGEHQASALLHPYTPEPPYLYRVFIEGSSLASVAVNLPHQVSYCWDAENCYLRFAWEGEFLDNTELWHGHKNAYAKVLGDIFYRDQTDFPLRIGSAESIPETEYKGYRLVERYPEFHYTLNGTNVYELIHPKSDGSGLLRTFRMPEAKETVWFVFHAEDGADYASSTGKWEDAQLKLSPQQAREFTITMTKTGKIQ